MVRAKIDNKIEIEIEMETAGETGAAFAAAIGARWNQLSDVSTGTGRVGWYGCILARDAYFLVAL